MAPFRIIEQDGRYIWAVHPATVNLSGFGFSPVSFSTEDAAKADCEVYLRSKRDGSGRTLRSAEQIGALLRVAAEACPECNGAAIPAPQWQKDDASACNWYMDVAGDDLVNCWSCLEGAITALQAAYNLCHKS